MFLIVGLGNPGPRYEVTRHNVGFMLADRLASSNGMAFRKVDGPGLAARGTVAGVETAILKPLTYMNRSGDAVSLHVRLLGVEPSEVLVAYDDVDLPPGRIRLRRGGGTGGHRGVASIAARLDTREFPRLRLGVGRPEPGGEAVSDYVLSPFEPGETDVLDGMLEKGELAVETFLRRGVEEAMNAFNARD